MSTLLADDIPHEAAQLGGVIGHRQVTDAYLVALARHHGGRVATLDKGLAALHGGDVLLLGASAAERCRVRRVPTPDPSSAG